MKIYKKDYEIEKDIIRTWSTFVPHDAVREITKTLTSGWINTGKKEKELRDTVISKWNLKNCVAVNSGTSALRAALAVVGVGPGDEVVTTPYTFIATNTAILEQGAKPVFADIKHEDLNIDPNSIEKNISKKTKAIMVVHYGGNTCDMDEIRKIGKVHNLPIIEDSAHALGSKYKGKFVGQEGDIVCFSLQVVKIINSGDGGLIIAPNIKYYKDLKEVIWYGIDRDDKKRSLLDPLPKSFKGDRLGFKYNMNDIIATLALVGVQNYDKPAKIRKIIGERYRKELGDVSGLTLMKYYNDRTPNYQIFPVHVKNRLSFAKKLLKYGIMVNVNNRRNDRYPMFGGLRHDLKNLEKADKDTILLPLHAGLTESQVDFLIKKIKIAMR